MKHLPLLTGLLVAASWVTLSTAWASDGHDHGAEGTAPVSEARPRFAAVSESFELVGVLDGRRITLYLDRHADNSPVRNAQIELDIAGTAYRAEPHGDDVYAVVLVTALQPGVLPLTATVTAGDQSDLLAGELDLHEHAPADEAVPTRSRREVGGWVVGGLVALALALWIAGHVKGLRSGRARGAA